MARWFPRGFFSKIALVAAAPMQSAAATPDALQQTVLALRGDWK